MSFDEPFTLPDGRIGHWKQCHPNGTNSFDERRHIVKGREVRAWVNDPTGKSTKAGHNKRKYYCVPCIAELGGPEPPKTYW